MNKRGKRFDHVYIALIITVFAIVAFVNARLIRQMMNSQIREVGQTQLDSIKNDFEGYISELENTLIKVSSGAQYLLGSEYTLKDMESYIVEQKRLQLAASKGSTFNVYIAGPGWSIIPDFDMPEDYHATARNWYVGAVESGGDIYITPPYIDSMTGDMCFTMSVLLADGETVVGMDFTLQLLQDSIERMSERTDSTAIIVTNDGTIAGYMDMSYVGQDIEKALPAYYDAFNKVLESGNEDMTFNYDVNGKTLIFSSKIKNNWCMMLSVKESELYGNADRQVAANIIINILLILVIIVIFRMSSKNRIRAEEALRSRELFVNKLSEKLTEPANKIIRLSDSENADSNAKIRDDLSEIKASGMEITDMINDLRSYSYIAADISREKDRDKKYRREISGKVRIIRNVIIILLLMIAVFNAFSIVKEENSKNDYQLLSVLDKSYSSFSRWQAEQKTVLEMFVHTISANPKLLDNYDEAVRWLDEVASNYPDISVCYLANPYKEETVIMNNGWKPDDDWRVEERDWYKKTEMSEYGFSISTPYYDEQTGNYCVTMSQMVYGREGEFLGIFGIDFYVDKLIDIMAAEYIEDYEYVFMVDPEGNIVNHPNAEYEMSGSNVVHIADTPYFEAYNNTVTGISDVRSYNFRDYNGAYSTCMALKDKSTGFSLIIVEKWWVLNMLSLTIASLVGLAVLVVIVAVIILLNKVIKSQAILNEELAEAADEANAAGRAKSEFLAQMSHEIRTPINAIIGMDEMILRESKDEEIKEYAQNVKSASNTLLTLINGILDLSKIESGKMEIVRVKYDLPDMIDNLVNMLSEKAEKKGLELKLKIDEKLPTTLYGDDMKIRQIITNILTNAVKYTDKGSIMLTMKAEEVSGEDVKIRVEVKDTGIGIRQEDMEKLFASFQRLDEERNRNIEGTGLGMSIVQGLLSMMDSKLEVDSEYGKGSAFAFTIVQKIIDHTPIGRYEDREKSEGPKEKAAREFTVKDADVLIVDDNDMNLAVIKGLMKKYVLVPDLCESGEECIEMVKDKHYDIIFMDHMMPDMDGIETLRELEKEGILAEDTVVIALTANAIVGAREMYLKEGFKDYLTKPVEPPLLEEMLMNYLPESKVVYKD